MKYKVGDRITFKRDLIVGKMYGRVTFLMTMISVIGKTFTIREGPTGEGNYKLYIDLERDLFYSPEMFSITNSKLFTLL